jgi:MoxR-like ATPase
LPEAQLDRFLFKILVDYPNLEEEKKILNVMENDKNIKIDKIIDLNKFMELQKQVSNVKISDNIKDYISRLVNISRKKDDRLLY